MSIKTSCLTFIPVLLCLCGTCYGVENGQDVNRVVRVEEGSDAVLPCSLGNQDLNYALFDWKKEDPNGPNQKDVFLYDAGVHNNNGRDTQHHQFKGRVSHFEDELQRGNASIKIHNTKMEDSGVYSCYFPHLDQIFRVELVVGVAAMPCIKTVNATDAWSLLQCDVRGASPEPIVKWKNSDGKVLLTQEPEVTESEGRFDITLLITVNQTGHYRCVVTQKELHHQTHAETFVHISEGKKCAAESQWWGWLILGLFIGGVTAFAAPWILAALRNRCRGSAHSNAVSKVDDDVCLLPTEGQKVVRMIVAEGSDVVLPCSLGNQDLTYALFHWRKEVANDQEEVFFYGAGANYNNGRGGQDPQFKGRVSHFEDELQHGNASIKIHSTKLEDSGDYTCYFPNLQRDQIFHVKLVVDGILKDRSGSPGVAPAPDTKTVKDTDNWLMLQCDVRGASPKPTVEWKNSDGKVLQAQEPEVTESKGRFDITLITTVDQTGHYRCVVTQEELNHQIYTDAFVHISGSETPWWGWFILGLVIGGVIVAALWILTVLRKQCCGSVHSNAVSKVDDDICLLPTKGLSNVRVIVAEGSDVVLPCFLRNQDLTGKVFDWSKGDQTVFLYDENIENGSHSGQDPQFKGRVSHFGSDLQHGNASIKIQNTKLEDSGDYSCHRSGQTFLVKLVVGDPNGLLSDSSISEISSISLLSLSKFTALNAPFSEFSSSSSSSSSHEPAEGTAHTALKAL
ncbi:uncharacterized protein V6R79_004389 [Siganus canaliculatus]